MGLRFAPHEPWRHLRPAPLHTPALCACAHCPHIYTDIAYLFLLHGTDDQVTNPNLSISFFNKVANSNKKLYLPKNTNHALFVGNDDNDIHPKIVWGKIFSWINNLIQI